MSGTQLKNNKKIYLIIDSLDIGGAEKSVLDLQKKLSASHEVKIFVLKGNVEKYYSSDYVVYLGSTRIFSLNTFVRLIKLIKNSKKRETIFISFAPEVAVAVNLALLLSFKKRINSSLVSFRNSPKFYKDRSGLYKFLLYFAVVNYCDGLHFLTNSNAKEYNLEFDRLRISNIKKHVVIPNHLRNYNQFEDFKHDKEVIIFVGRLHPQKQPFDFVEFVSMLEQSFPNKYRYKMLGEGSLRVALQKKIYESKLSSKISILGKVENINDFYREASHMIVTSDFEGHPGAIFEAIQSGVRVISYPYDDRICDFFSKLNGSHVCETRTPESLFQVFIQHKNDLIDPKEDIQFIEKELSESKLTQNWLNFLDQF